MVGCSRSLWPTGFPVERRALDEGNNLWGGIALGGAGAALIVFGARQRINAFQPEIAVPFGRSERSALVFGIGRRPTASYRFGW
jgi:hypothetical protein